MEKSAENYCEGEHRWVYSDEWLVARLEEMLDDYGEMKMFFCTTDGCQWAEEDLAYIGPAIDTLPPGLRHT